jgi:methionyl-tRNA formyltransferase
LGTPEFAVPTLEAMLSSSHVVVGVVTQPDRPRGRGQRTTDAPVKVVATRARCPILQPVALKHPAFLEALAALDADIGVVAAYGRILPEAAIETPRLGMINVHASLLPRYRGAAPVHRAVMAGDTITGVTIMRVVKALDAGPMLATVQRSIGADETSVDVEQGLAALGASLLVETLDRLASGPVPETAQDERLATYAPKITREDGRVDWSRPARQIHDLVRGLHPWPHAASFVGSRRVIVHRSQVAGYESPGQAPGTIAVADGGRLDVVTGDGVLRLLELQKEGGRPLPTRDFLAGFALAPGDRFESS